jgi:hypothetical protein
MTRPHQIEETAHPTLDGVRVISWRPDVPGAAAIPFAAHHGLPDAVARAWSALGRWSRAWACGEAVRSSGKDLLEVLRRYEGFSQAVHQAQATAKDRSAEGMAAEENAVLAGMLMVDDAFRATSAIAKEYRIDGSEELYGVVLGLLREIERGRWKQEAASQAASRLAKASPGPSTAISRALAAFSGRPPAPDAIAMVEHGPASPTGRTACIGTVLVTPSQYRDGTPSVAPVELTVLVDFDPFEMEFAPDGSIEFADVRCRIAYDPALWDASRDGDLYHEPDAEKAVLALFERRGLSAKAGWSERGRQQSGMGDMDIDHSVAEEIWPDLVAQARADGPAFSLGG